MALINRNITLKSWQKNLLWSMFAIMVTGVLFLAVERKSNATVSDVAVSIKGIDGNKNLISEKIVKQMFRNYLGYDLEVMQVKDLDLRDLELMLKSDERVEDAEIYIDNKERLHIVVEQREPIVRVFSNDKSTFYLDVNGKEIPAYKGSTIRVPVASGNIEGYSTTIMDDKNNSRLRDVYMISKFIHEDPFLTALIEQINVTTSGEILLVPKIGRQKLAFGDASELSEKFEKLKLLYKEGLPHLGWRKYDVLTLKYDGQVVGTLRN